MHPLKGRTPARRWAALQSKRLAVPMCVSGGFISKNEKRKAAASSQSDITRAVSCRGAGRVSSV